MQGGAHGGLARKKATVLLFLVKRGASFACDRALCGTKRSDCRTEGLSTKAGRALCDRGLFIVCNKGVGGEGTVTPFFPLTSLAIFDKLYVL